VNRRTTLGFVVVVVAFSCALLCCPSPKDKETALADAAVAAIDTAPQKKAIDPTTTATVTGVITFSGTPPPSTMLTASSADCQAARPKEFSAEDVKVNGGKVQDAFVWVKSGLEAYAFPLPKEPVKVDQKGCMYHPRIIGVRAGQDLEFTNSDATLHNISSKPASQGGWNFVTPQGMAGKRSFKKPEVPVKIGCDVHPWMKAYVGVVDHPFFAITGPEGTFTMPGLPAGTYTIGVWHERLGGTEQSVTISAKELKNVTMELRGSAPQ
jgi:plastocyanin